jgi:HEPN domain-containing protein
MKQTAVEWLRKELLKRDMDISIKNLFEQAKEMEKQQIKDAYIDGEFTEGYGDDAEQYYNETFKK